MSDRMLAAFTMALLGIVFGFGDGHVSAADKKMPPKITFDDHVKPIFRAKCFACHNTSKKSGGLDLTTFTALMQGGSSGEVIAPGNAGDSYLYGLVTHKSEPFMPPKSEKLAAASLETIRKWIDDGALENSGSKAIAVKKKFDLALESFTNARPAGPPPMPGRLSRQPVLRTDNTTAVTALATSPWAPLAAVAGQKQVFLYDTKSLSLLGVLPFPEGIPNVLKFSRNGSLLMAAGGKSGANGRAIVWDVKTGRRVIELGDEVDCVLAADISSDHRFIALGGPQKLVRIYSTETGKLIHEIKKHTDWVTAIEFSPDGVLLASGDRNGGTFIWEALTAREYLSLNGHKGQITGLSWRNDSNVVASCSEDATVKLWEMQNGAQIKNWGAHGGGTTAVEFTRDGRIATTGRDRTAKLWDQNGAAQRTFPAFADIALQVTHCDETNLVIAGDWSGAVRVWNAADGKQVGELSTNPQTIELRIAAVQADIAKLDTAAKSLAAAYTTSKQTADKIQADLNSANQSLANHKKLLATAQATVQSTQAALKKYAVDIPAATKAMTALEVVIKPLTESVTKGQEAAKNAPGDKTLASAVAQLAAELEKQKVAHTAAGKSLAALKTADAQAKQQLAAAQKQITDSNTAITAATKQIAALTPTLKPAVDNAAKAKLAADAAAKTLADEQAKLKSLQQSLKIETALKDLATQQAGYEKLATAAVMEKANVEKKQAEVTAAKQQLAAAQKQADTAAAVAKQADSTLTQAVAQKSAAESGIKTLETAIPLLTDAMAKAKDAAAKVAGDKEIAATVAQIQTVLTRKTTELATLKKDLPAKVAAVTAAQQQSDAVKKKAAEMTSQVKAATDKVTALQTALTVAEKQAAAANAAAEAARQQVQKTQSAITALDSPASNEQASAKK